MCEEFTEECSGGPPSRFLLTERRSYRCQAYAHQVLILCYSSLIPTLFFYFSWMGYYGEVLNVLFSFFRDGKSRQFAFVGFRTESEAEEAIKYFNKAYLGPSRITCEVYYRSFLFFSHML